MFMGYYDDRNTGGIYLLKQVHHFIRCFGVQGAGGLIGQNNFGLGYHGSGNGHPLLLAAGQFTGHVSGPIAHAHFFHVFQCDPVAFFPADFLVVKRQRHIFQGILKGDEVEGLEDKTEKTITEIC